MHACAHRCETEININNGPRGFREYAVLTHIHTHPRQTDVYKKETRVGLGFVCATVCVNVIFKL